MKAKNVNPYDLSSVSAADRARRGRSSRQSEERGKMRARDVNPYDLSSVAAARRSRGEVDNKMRFTMNKEEAHPPLSSAVISVLDLKKRYETVWRDMPEQYWYGRLCEELSELKDALAGFHEHPPDRELTQIASIALNWLEMRSTAILAARS